MSGNGAGRSGVRGAADGGRVLEVACDESGSDGENLTGGNTDVFAHASVALPVDRAEACVREIRRRIRSPAQEYKAGHLLREKHRAVLEWLLDEDGPVHGHAHVHLTEKAFLVVDRVVDLLLGDTAEARPLFGQGPAAFGERGWREFLEVSNQLLRIRSSGRPPTESFFRTVGELGRVHAGTEAGRTLLRLAGARPRAEAYRARLAEAPPLIPVLNPLLPALVRTAGYWSAGGQAVRLVHDRQNMLTPERIAWIEERARQEGIGLAGVRLVHSRLDARVQIADFLAGIARKIASDELGGRADAARTARLRPFVGAESVWGDARSWSRLGPGTEDAPGAEQINSGV
ncbi:hypothetical protein AVL59_17860 [Streptomyces griseochromogenes]|uniref:DUF3800 domain-containing protein n=1 Tax=Streptomyces griseochromogenes TaxID=68214 RepID=A0A1B1BCV0_9ACTN|nr:hypothetical protein AVL59_17860 [Streptomyces griseochromogenes]